MTAAQKLMVLGGKATCDLFRCHLALRWQMKPETLDAPSLRKLAQEADRAADAIETGRPMHKWGSTDIAIHVRAND